MRKYELIKQYPGSDHVGVVVSQKTLNGMYEGWEYNYYKRHVENNPEYWEEVIEKNYEIISYVAKDCYGITIPGSQYPDSPCKLPKDYWKIHSVKRLSDGEVFTVGDKITGYSYKDARSIQTIKICTYTGIIKLEREKGFTILDSATKIKQPIFLTHDGKDIFAGDKVWWVRKDSTSIIGRLIVSPGEKFGSDMTAYFLTEEAASDYIKRNKVLSITADGKDIFAGDKVWWVDKKTFCSDYFVPTPSVTFFSDINVYFLTEEAAEDYVNRNKVLFTTEDGVGIKKGDTFYFVDTDLSIGLSNTKYEKCDGRKYFTTIETAQYYMIVNAKVLSIEDFWNFSRGNGSPNTIEKQLKKEVKERLNLK